MSMIRDYTLIDLEPNQGNEKVINVVGHAIVVRRGEIAGQIRIKAYEKEGGALIADNILEAGEKILTATRFTRLEVSNMENFARNVVITAGDGDFQSDVVEGQVTVTSNPSNPLDVVGQVNVINDVDNPVGINNKPENPLYIEGTVIARQAKFGNISHGYSHTKGTNTVITVPPKAVKVAVQNMTPATALLYVSGAHLTLQPHQLYSTECSEDIELIIDKAAETGWVSVFWVTQP